MSVTGEGKTFVESCMVTEKSPEVVENRLANKQEEEV